VSSAERTAEALLLGAGRAVTALDDPDLGPFHLALDGVAGPLLTTVVRRLRDFTGGQGWNARVQGFISEYPEETKGEDLSILVRLVAAGRLSPKLRPAARRHSPLTSNCLSCNQNTFKCLPGLRGMQYRLRGNCGAQHVRCVW
jgi:hypothetical protein